MPKTKSALIQYIHKIAGAYKEDGRSDADLLACVAEFHDDQAFTTLMVRHGFLVWSICRSILGNAEDAEDALQSTFMALARNAAKIKVTNSLAGWLQRVARHAALDARSATQSRQRLKAKLHNLDSLSGDVGSRRKDVYEALHEQLSKLPEKLRVPLVLHYLENKSQVEVSNILGVTKQTVRNRLEQGKCRLEKQLTRYGLTIGAATIGSLFAKTVAQAAMPLGLVGKTVQTAMAFRDGKLTGGLAKLANEVLKHAPSATPWWKTGWMITILCVCGLSVGAGGVAWQTGYFDADASGKPPAAMQNAAQPSEKANRDSNRLDAYGDPLPEGALARLGTVRFHHDRSDPGSDCVTITADKKLVIPTTLRYRDAFFRYRCYDLTTGKPLKEIRDSQGLAVPLDQNTFISQDGRLIARQGASGAGFTLWNLPAKSPLNNKVADKLLDSKHKVLMALSRDGNRVAKAVRANGELEFSVWDNGSPKARWIKTYKNYWPLQLMYSSNDKILMAVCELGSGPEYLVKRWEVATGKKLASRAVPRQGGPFAWSNDGETIAVCSKFQGNTVCIWNMATGEKVRDIRLGDDNIAILNLALSPDAGILAARTVDRKTRGPGPGCSRELWDATTGKLLRRWSSPIAETGNVVFSQDAKWLASLPGDSDSIRSIVIWDVASGKRVNQVWHERGHNDVIESLAFSPKGDMLTSLSRCGDLIQWRADRESDCFSICRTTVCFDEGSFSNSNGVGVAAATRNGAVAVYHDGKKIRLWDATTGRVTWTFAAPPGGVAGQLAFCPKKNIVANTVVLDNDGVGVLVYDVAAAKYGDVVVGGKFAFSPNGKWLTVGTSEGFSVWDSVGHRKVAEARAGEICDLAYSPDRRTLAVSARRKGSEDAIYLWQIYEDGESARLEGPRTFILAKPAIESLWCYISKLTFSPDGRRLTATRRDARRDHNHSSDIVIHVWETATGEERRRFNEGGSLATALAFSPDGRRLASGHEDASILIWDATGRLIGKKLCPENLSEAALTDLWADLAGGDAARADRAIWSLAAAGPRTVLFFKTRLRPAPKKRVAAEASRLVADLDAKKFAVRRKANLELKRLGKGVEAKLREALRERPSVELRRSVEMLLKQIEQERVTRVASSEDLRMLRVIEVLQQIENVEARQMLEVLSSGDPDPRLTEEAQAGLAYWKALHQSK